MSNQEALNWNHNLETGDDTVDLQHRELFQLVSSLDAAIREHDLSKIDEIIAFLEHYVVDHFDAEESLMVSAKFEGYAHHKEEHDHFEALVHKLREMRTQNLSKTHLIFAIRKFIDQLVIHIRTVDIRIADIVHSHNHDNSESPQSI